MIKFIISILDLLVSIATLYMVVMTNQNKVVDIPGNIPSIGKLTDTPSEDVSQSSGGEEKLGSGLRAGRDVSRSFSSLASRSRLNLKL